MTSSRCILQTFTGAALRCTRGLGSRLAPAPRRPSGTLGWGGPLLAAWQSVAASPTRVHTWVFYLSKRTRTSVGGSFSVSLGQGAPPAPACPAASSRQAHFNIYFCAVTATTTETRPRAEGPHHPSRPPNLLLDVSPLHPATIKVLVQSLPACAPCFATPTPAPWPPQESFLCGQPGPPWHWGGGWPAAVASTRGR